jgi:hypothetical protein
VSHCAWPILFLNKKEILRCKLKTKYGVCMLKNIMLMEEISKAANCEFYCVHGLEDSVHSGKIPNFPKLMYRFNEIPRRIQQYFCRYGQDLYGKAKELE